MSHRTAGVDADLVHRHTRGDILPVQAEIAQRIGRRIDRHLQTARMVARGIELAGVKAGGQLAGGFHVEFTHGRQQQILLPVDLHPDVGHRGRSHHPVRRDDIRQVFTLEVKLDRLIITVHWQPLIPAHSIDVEMIGADTSDQRVVQDVLRLRCVGIEPHQGYQRRQCALALRQRLGRVGHSGERVMSRASPGGIDTAKTHNYR